MKTKNNIYTPILVSVILGLLFISRYIDASILTRENEYTAVLILECVIFAIPTVIFTRLFVPKPANTLKVSFFGIGALPIILVSGFILISGSILYGLLTASLEVDAPSSFKLYDLFVAKRSDSFINSLYLAFAYALIPAIFEEFVFRGAVSAKYEVISPVYSVIMSSIMFGFIHLDLLMLPFHIFAGIILSLSLYATRSIFVPIIIHFIYNLFFIFFPSYISAIYISDNSFFMFIAGLVFFVSLAFFSAECRRIYKKRAETSPVNEHKEALEAVKINPAEVFFAPSAVICYLMYFTAILIIKNT